jgi:HKD family nuclease
MPGDRIMVVSPFIDTSTLSWLTARIKDYNYESKNSILITRKEYVTQEVFDLFDQVWVPNDTMIDNTTANVDLHAKMYLTQRVTGQDLGYTLYLGSTNATDNGFNRNAEFLLRLHYKRTTNDRIKELLEEMVSEHRFIVMEAPNPEATNTRPKNEKELALKRAIGCLKKAEITKGETEGLYDIVLSIGGKFEEGIEIRPLQLKASWQPIAKQIRYTDISAYMLSEFYVLRIPVEEGFMEMVAKVKTSNMPKDRDEAIYQSIVTKKEELLDYVAFMLSDRPSEFFFEQKIMQEKNKELDGITSQATTMPLYEQLLRTASTNPEQITEVLKFIKKMKKDIVPEELKRILEMFQNVSKQIAAL